MFRVSRGHLPATMMKATASKYLFKTRAETCKEQSRGGTFSRPGDSNTHGLMNLQFKLQSCMQGLSCLPCHRVPTCFPYMPQTCHGKTLHFLVFLGFFFGATGAAGLAPPFSVGSAPESPGRFLPEALALGAAARESPGVLTAGSFFSYFFAFLGPRVPPE